MISNGASLEQPGGRRPGAHPTAPPAPLLSTDDIIEHTGLTRRILHYWTRDGHITPTQPAAGTGTRIGWSQHDAQALKAIAQVRRDLLSIGASAPRTLATELWDQLDTADTATIEAGTVNITVHLQPETT